MQTLCAEKEKDFFPSHFNNFITWQHKPSKDVPALSYHMVTLSRYTVTFSGTWLHSQVHGYILRYMVTFSGTWLHCQGTWLHSEVHGYILRYMVTFSGTWLHSEVHGYILRYMVTF